MNYYGRVIVKRTDELKHWKYIKRVKVGDKYRYYYDETKNASTNDDSKTQNDGTKTSEKPSNENKESDGGFDLDEMANKIIRGEFKNGEERKKFLGESYADVQHRVNEILLGEAKAKEILERKNKK